MANYSIILIFWGLVMNETKKELDVVKYSDAAIKVLHYKMKCGALCFVPHWHDRVEIIRVKNGEMLIEYGGNAYTLKKDEMTIFLPRMVHKGIAADTDVEYDVLMFDVRFFYNDTVVCNKTLPLILNGSAKFETVISNQETINCSDEICNNKDLDSLQIISLIYKLLYLFFEKHLIEMKVHKQDTITKFIEYIEENFELDLNSAMLSEKFGYSNEHFCRKFKEATGTTPMTYLKIFRLSQAADKLKSGNKNVSEIASLCGFSDANYFTRCFKAHYGFTPINYKKNYLKNKNV